MICPIDFPSGQALETALAKCNYFTFYNDLYQNRELILIDKNESFGV